MKQCYLCGASADIQEESDGFFVKCTGSCGPYIITRIALGDLTKIFGRKDWHSIRLAPGDVPRAVVTGLA